MPGIEAIARGMGIETPVEGGRLRAVDDACVFSTPEGLCAIHRDHGAAAKPAICQQYPLVALRVDGVRRVGVDPGCYTAWRTWRTGEALDPGPLLLTPTSADPGLAHLEARLLGLLDAEGWRGLLVALTGPGFEARWIAALNSLNLGELLSRPGTSRDQRAGLAGLVAALPGLTPSPEAVAPGQLDLETNAWCNEVVRRMLHLRLASSVPTPAAVAVLVTGGILVLSRVDPRPERFGPALSAWTRAIRAPQLWGRLLPSPEAMRALARG